MPSPNRPVGGGIRKEQDSIMAAQIVQITANLRQAVLRMRMSGVPATNILFHTNDGSGPCTVTDGTCLFTPEGGGVSVPVVGRDIPQAAYEPSFYGNPLNMLLVEVNEGATGTGMPSNMIVGAGGPGTDGAWALIGLTKGVCEAINRGLGIASIPTFDLTAAQATLPAYQTIDLGGMTEACIDMSAVIAPGVYEYFATLIEN